ncbi:MAG: DegT/DnrJ/EryC1/StrS family aminotransferase [Bacteroidia bacterium]
MINVTKVYLPQPKKYNRYLGQIWKRAWVTNRGPLVLELEEKLKKHLGVKNMLFVSNGTVAIQIAIKALDLKGEIITTPFSYVATTTSILWENCKPVFVDIEDKTFCIDASLIERSITPKTTAILATHVYGYPCNVKMIEKIAKKHGLKVIYDAAHAFGTNYNGKSVLNYGDISTLSFHATKLYHTIEGGGIIVNSSKALTEKVNLYHTFGHLGDDYYTMGINGKNSEFHAAMGLCNLPEVTRVISGRKKISLQYDKQLLPLGLKRPVSSKNVDYNYAYYPVLFENERALLKVKKLLAENGINTRRYFYPSLNKLPYLNKTSDCPVSEDTAKRVLCLPLYHQLEMKTVNIICSLIKQSLKAI